MHVEKLWKDPVERGRERERNRSFCWDREMDEQANQSTYVEIPKKMEKYEIYRNMWSLCLGFSLSFWGCYSPHWRRRRLISLMDPPLRSLIFPATLYPPVSSNMACWKMDHLSVIFIITPPFIGDHHRLNSPISFQNFPTTVGQHGSTATAAHSSE